MVKRASTKRTPAPRSNGRGQKLDARAESSRKPSEKAKASSRSPASARSVALNNGTRLEINFRLPKENTGTVQEIAARLGKPDSYVLLALQKHVKTALALGLRTSDWAYDDKAIAPILDLTRTATIPFYRQSMTLTPSQIDQLHDVADDPLQALDSKEILKAIAILAAKDQLTEFKQKTK